MDAPRHDVYERLRHALVRHVHDVDARGKPELLRVQMRAAADPGRAEVQLSRLLLGQRDQLLHRFRAERGAITSSTLVLTAIWLAGAKSLMGSYGSFE